MLRLVLLCFLVFFMYVLGFVFLLISTNSNHNASFAPFKCLPNSRLPRSGMGRALSRGMRSIRYANGKKRAFSRKRGGFLDETSRCRRQADKIVEVLEETSRTVELVHF